MRLFHFVVVLTPVLTLCACSSTPRTVKVDPFVTSKKAFKKTVRIIAVAPVLVPEGLPDTTHVTDKFSRLIDEELNRYGYSIVRPQEYERTWKTVVGSAGDFVDSTTGEREEVAMSRAMSRTLRELNADFEIGGVMFPSIVVVEAPFSARTAVWDGVEQRVETAGPMERFLAGSQHGVVGALSLKITIRSADGKVLFVNSGGIEVLSQMVGKKFVAVPRQTLFSDEERNRRAVKVALKPLKR
jgi:hypothetical protein